MSTTTATSAAGRHRSTGRLRALAGLAALSVALLSTGCSSAPADTATSAPRATVTAAPSTAVTEASTVEAPAAVGTSAPEAPEPAALVVRPTGAVDVHESPDASSASRTIPATNSFGSATALLVTDQAPGWVQVLVPGRPTGARGWLSNDDAGTLQSVSMEIHVDLEARTLVLTDGDTEVLRTSVAVGSPDTPTPTGTFSVTDKLDTQEPDSAYGRYAVGLSARSEVISEFAGGDGQIGIHGTNEPDSIGNAVSHGCIRAPQAVMEQLNSLLSLGTPVVVS